MRANVVKTVVNSVPHEGIDAVGVERTIPENPLRRKSDQKHWYIAIVNNKSENSSWAVRLSHRSFRQVRA